MTIISFVWSLILYGIGFFGGYKAANWIIDRLNSMEWFENAINSISNTTARKVVSWTIVGVIYLASLIIVFDVAKLVLFPITRLVM